MRRTSSQPHSGPARIDARLSTLLAALALLALGVACGTTAVASRGGADTAGDAGSAKRARESGSDTPAREAASPKPAVSPKPAASDADRERYAHAEWAPGQLEAHFRKHGAEGPYHSAAEYDTAARETIRRGTMFSYVDRESDAERLGFYDKPANRFTGLTRNGQRITTHFRPNRGEAYVRGLERSTYR